MLPRRDDRQCAHHRRGGLFPGVGVRAAHPAQRLGQRCRAASSSNVDRHSRTARRGAGVKRHLLHAGLDRRALSGARSAHRATADTNSRATASRIIAPPSRTATNSPPTSGSRRRCWRTSPDARCAAIARRASPSARRTRGLSTASAKRAIATAPASIRSATTTTACLTRRVLRTRPRRG